MLLRVILMGGLAFAVGTDATSAGEANRPPMRGTDGLTRLDFSARNAADRPIICGIATAHWYSVDLGTAGPAAAIRTTLWASVPTGEVFILNDKEDRLPVEDLWCGFAGEAWATRSAITLDRRAGSTPGAIDVICSGQFRRLDCRAQVR